MTIDLGQVAREIGLPPDKVQRTVDLLDDGNTVPFITRYRKDQTGALDEEQIRLIQDHVCKLRMLAERKQTILKSIESQGKLTPELAQHIGSARSTKRLEDLYLPYKPKKQTLATVARQRGLEPLARELMEAAPAALDLDTRAKDFVSPDRQLGSVAEVLLGVGHLLAERFSENAELRGRLRKILHRSGKLACTRIESPESDSPAGSDSPLESTESTTAAAPVADEESVAETTAVAPAADETNPAETNSGEANSEQVESVEPSTSQPSAGQPSADEPSADEPSADEPSADQPSADEPSADQPSADQPSAEQPSAEQPNAEQPNAEQPNAEQPSAEQPSAEQPSAEQPSAEQPSAEQPSAEQPSADQPSAEQPSADQPSAEQPSAEQPSAEQPSAEQPSAEQPSAEQPSADQPSAEQSNSAEAGSTGKASSTGESSGAAPPQATAVAPAAARTKSAASARRAKQRKKQQKLEAAFKDYFNFEESITRVPPHRVLAINRGERAKILRVKVTADVQAMVDEAEKLLLPTEHPHGDFLRGCARDALNRLVIPSLEREVRRELTERAEEHAVDVFVRNLRKLMLQPPVRGHRVLAIDPGFRSGCKLTALDEFGNVLSHGIMHTVGNEKRVQAGRARLLKLISDHSVSLVAIGNGTACRETEQLVADLISNELQGRDVAFVIVNEAGASVYSTSPLGREELPDYDPSLRSAISIGRRLLDPLSELVKINPSNIGVGMYQHDVKAKHLRNSLDAVVESCVNYVGVDVNTASPALLRYVSGLNQLTARRLYEYRCEHGPFKSREQFTEVPSFGDATFVQAAGFLRIPGGDNPLDATWIHPESYTVARRVLEKLGSSVNELAQSVAPASPPAVAGKEAEPSSAEQGSPPSVSTTSAPPPSEAPASSESSSSGDSSTPLLLGAVQTPPPSDDAQAQSSPSEVQAQSPPSEVQAPSSPSEVQAPSSPSEVQAQSPPSEVQAPSSPSEVQAPSPPSEVQAPSSPGEVQAPSSPSEVQAQSSPSEVQAPSPPSEVQAPSSPGEVQAPSPPSEVQAPSPSGEVQTPSPSGDAQTAPDGAMAAAESLAQQAARVDASALAEELGIGQLLLKDILAALTRPGRDPREDLPPPVFRRGIMKLEDLQAGMELAGSVLNVVDFGAFVDIGLTDSGLVHISRLADRYVRDPHEVVSVGDTLRVWVVDVDKSRRRVSLTAVQPGTEKPREARGSRERAPAKKGGARPPRQKQAGRGAASGRKSARAGKAGRSGKPKPVRRPPKPVTPITKAMEEGKEPMRSFSDLLQFYEGKNDEPGSGKQEDSR